MEIRPPAAVPGCPLYIVYRAMSIGRKIFWPQIILANCHQIKIRKKAIIQAFSQIATKSKFFGFKSFSQIATKSKFAKAIIQAFSQKGRKQDKQDKQSIVS